jgi:short-subunit dehydrogenase
MRNLQGKTAIVTGAAGGIGTQVAKILNENGVKLVLTDINQAGLEKTAAMLSGSVVIFKCDITNREEVKALVSETVKNFGTLDILVNNAGIIIPSLFEDCPFEDIEKQLRINFMGAVTCSHEAIPVMKKTGGGHIVTVSSMAGLVPETYSSIYTATKFALRGFNLTLGIELRKHKIGVSTIFPDSVATPMLRYEASHGGSPLTFLSPPQEPVTIARAILKAILKNKAEVYCPTSTGIFSKAIMCWPWAVTKIWPVLEFMGTKKRPVVEKELMKSIPE